MYKITVPVRCKTAHEHKESTLAQLRRCGAHRVAIAIHRELSYRFSSQETLDKLTELIEYFEKNGLEVLVWIGETLGHDRVSSPVHDWGFTNIKDPDGNSTAAFCPLDEDFSDAIAEWVGSVAGCGAKLILLDDDFRMGDRFGCSCEHHMKVVRDRLGEEIDAKTLMPKVLCGGKSKYRDAYLKAQGDGLRRMAQKIRNAVSKISPDIRIGACVTMSRWDCDGADPFEIGKILAGKNKPFLRTFGAPYHYAFTHLANSVEMERTQLDWCKGKGFEVITEGDTYPRPRFACPAAYLECFDMILRADGGSDGIMRYMIDYVSSPDYEVGYADYYNRNAENYRSIEKLFNGGECIGFKPYLPLDKISTAELKCDLPNSFSTLCELPFEYVSAYNLLTCSSLPISYSNGCPSVVFGESARHITEKELKYGSVIDMDAAIILKGRGIDVGLKCVSDDDLFIQDGFYDLPIEYFPKANDTVRLDALPIKAFQVDSRAEVLSQIIKGEKTFDFVYRYKNRNGQKFLVLPFSAKQVKDKLGFFKNYYRKEALTDAFFWFSSRPLDAYIDSRTPMLYMMAKRNENALSIGIWNLFQDRADNVKIKVNTDFCNVEFTNCRGKVEKDCITIESCIYPYEFTGIKIITNNT